MSGRRIRLRGAGGTPLAIPDPVQLSSAFATIVKQSAAGGREYLDHASDRSTERRGRATPGQRNRDGEMGPRTISRTRQQPFQDFFNRFFDFPDQGPTAERSLGSGVIVDKKGFILTNNHVVDQATKIQVARRRTTPYTAKIVGIDEETDLAV